MSSSFTLTNDSASDYKFHPEFGASVSTSSEAPDWLLYSYYAGFLFYSMVAIVVSAGAIYNKMECSVYKNGASTPALVFEIFGYIVIVLSVVVMIMSILAMSLRMGFSQQLKAVYNKFESRPSAFVDSSSGEMNKYANPMNDLSV